MALFNRRDKPPAEAVAGFVPGERVVSFADTVDGVVVATQFGLWWPEPDGPRLIRWQHIDKAVWRDDVLVVTEAEVVDDAFLVDRAPVSVFVTVARDLPPTVRKRVEANIVERELVTVGGGAVRFVARREPGRDGVRWFAHLEPGTPNTVSTRSAVLARLERLRVNGSGAR